MAAELQGSSYRAREERLQHVIGWIACALTMLLAVGVYGLVFLRSWLQDEWLCGPPSRLVAIVDVIGAAVGALSLVLLLRILCGPVNVYRRLDVSAFLALWLICFVAIGAATQLLSCLALHPT